ncbi:phage head-tail adapter protein [Enterococcus larvae]|uniref:phage head-tail adapter protein n=1 Tax=Enterococcus larvae TaxID=2794352 RepID=UPI003F2C5D57
MNKEWSELNKSMQNQIKKEETFEQGIETLLLLRKKLMEQISSFKMELDGAAFHAQPFLNAKGYHNKTIAYSIYHIFRIEDIIAQSLIKKQEQLFVKENFQERMGASICTTGNELVKEEIAEFSRQLDLKELYHYILAVDLATTRLLKELSYSDLKIRMTEADKRVLLKTKSVADSEEWLIDYWCGKDISGLLRMPLSRHWVMHVEASLRIQKKIL